MSLSLIVAAASNDCIGKNNELLWKIPEDMKFFRETTTGHTIIMGKKTFLSIGRALPNRRNIVITNDKEFKHSGIEVMHSIDEVIAKYSDSPEEVFVIGGGEIYKQLMPFSKHIYMTRVHHDFDGDVFFPKISNLHWGIVNSRTIEPNEQTPYRLEFITYKNITPIP